MIKWILFLGLYLMYACHPVAQTGQKNEPVKAKSRMPEMAYYTDIDGDGVFEKSILDEVPVPVQGNDAFMMQFYKSIRYPASARESGIQGAVVLEVSLDAFGKVTQVKVGKSVSPDCDRESVRAFKEVSEKGYSPAIMGGKPVACKMEYPVGFWLN